MWIHEIQEIKPTLYRIPIQLKYCGLIIVHIFKYLGCNTGGIFNGVIATLFTLVFFIRALSLIRISWFWSVRRFQRRIIWWTWAWIRVNWCMCYQFGWVVVWRRIYCMWDACLRWLAIWWWCKENCSIIKVAWYRYRRGCMYLWHVIIFQRCSRGKCTGLFCCRMCTSLCIMWNSRQHFV